MKICILEDIVLNPMGQLLRPFPETDGIIFVDDTDFCANAIKSNNPDKKLKRLNGKTFYGGYFRHIWGHFLMGTLARLWPFTTGKLKVDDFENSVFFSDNAKTDEQITGNYLWMFKILGIENKYKILSDSVIIDNLTTAEPGLEHDVYASDQVRKLYTYIRTRGIGYSDKTPGYLGKKLFLTRSALKDAKKDEINIKKIEAIFSDGGYNIISPEKISIPDIIAAMGNCESIVSISGSLAHNFLLANPQNNTQFTVLERNPYFTSFQSCTDIIQNIRPFYVDVAFLPLLSSSQGRVVLFGPTDQFKKYAEDFGLNISHFKSDNSSRRKELLKYIKRYRRYNGEGMAIRHWEIETGNLFAEAIIDTKNRYYPWLESAIALTWYDWLTPRMAVRSIMYYLRSIRKS